MTWRDAKFIYRRLLSWHKAKNTKWNHRGIVEQVLNGLDNEGIKKNAADGDRHIRQAEPIKELHYEVPPSLNWEDDMDVINQARAVDVSGSSSRSEEPGQ